MTWWNRKSKPEEGPDPDRASKEVVEVLHQTKHPIRGDEPYLSFGQSHMIVNFSAGHLGSHNFFEGRVSPFFGLRRGDVLAFQIVRLTRVPMKWHERLWAWAKGLK